MMPPPWERVEGEPRLPGGFRLQAGGASARQALRRAAVRRRTPMEDTGKEEAPPPPTDGSSSSREAGVKRRTVAETLQSLDWVSS